MERTHQMAKNPQQVIGYQDQRDRLHAALETKVKFSLIEGVWGSGKTKLLLETKEKYPGIRIVDGSTLSLINAIEKDLAKPGFIQNLMSRVTNKRLDPIAFLEKYDKPLVLYFDENRLIEQTILQIKNVVTDNDNLQAVFALTPEQKIQMFTAYPEMANRFNAAAHIILEGLTVPERMQFVDAYASMPFTEGAKNYVAEKKNPQQMIDRIEQLEVDAKINKLSTVDESLISGYKEPVTIRTTATTEVSQTADLSPMARNILDVVNQSATSGGITSKEIAEKLGKSPESIHVRMVELRKKKLVTSIGRKVVPFQAENQAGIGP